MKITMTHYIAQSVKRFWFGREAIAAGIGALLGGIILSMIAAGTQVATYTINMSNTENYGVSTGKYVSGLNTCSNITNQATLTTCSDALKQSALAYLGYLKAPTDIQNGLVVTPGFWCPADSKFVSTLNKNQGNGCSGVSNNTPVPSVQVQLTSNWSAAVLKSTLQRLNKQFTWTFVGTRVTEVATTEVCEGITLERDMFIRSDGTTGLYDDKKGELSAEGKKLITLNYGDPITIAGKMHTRPWLYMNASSEDKPSLPGPESTSSTIKASFSAPSTSTDSNGDKRTKLDNGGSKRGVTDSTLSISQSNIGKQCTDADYGKRACNDNGGPAALRNVKKKEGKTCIALFHDTSDSTDKKYVKDGIEIKIVKVCTGSRDRKSDGKGSYIKDTTDSSKWKMFAMDETHQNYDATCPDGTLNDPAQQIKFYLQDRSSESDDTVQTSYSRYKGKNVGGSNEAKGIKGTHEMAERKTAYVN